MNVAEVLQDSDYKLFQFTAEEIDSLEQAVILKQTKSGETHYVRCLIRHKEIGLSPEEVIRQLYLRVLTDRYQYSTNRIRVEYEVSFGREKKRADIAIMDKDCPMVPYIIVELKKPKLKDGKDPVALVLQCHRIADRGHDRRQVEHRSQQAHHGDGKDADRHKIERQLIHVHKRLSFTTVF